MTLNHAKTVFLAAALAAPSSFATPLYFDNDSGAPVYTDTFKSTDASYSATGAYGPTARISWYSATNKAAVWNFSLPETGRYRISAAWPTSDTSRTGFSTQAPFHITHSAGTSIVPVNQTIASKNQVDADPDGFIMLGEYEFTAGSNYQIQLKNTVSKRVMADAIKIEAISVTPPPPPSQSDAGLDQTVHQNETHLSANTPETGTGRWHLEAGSALIVDPTDPNTKVRYLAPGLNTFSWNISHNDQENSDTVDIDYLKAVSKAEAGENQWLYSDNTLLNAEQPQLGTGSWSLAAGNAALSDMLDPNTLASDLSPGINQFLWTVKNAEHESIDRTVVYLDSLFGNKSSTIAGTGSYGSSGDNGPATSARFTRLSGITIDSTGNIYLSDSSRIRRIDAATGVITHFAGNKSSSGFSGDEGPASSALLSSPAGLAVDWQDNLIIADRNNNRIRRIDTKTGIISTIAGKGVSSMGGNNGDGGFAVKAAVNYPEDVAVDRDGNIYFADSRHDRIRKIDATTGFISTVAGSGGWGNDHGYTGDGGPATQAKLNAPQGLSIDYEGNIFIADTDNGVIRRIDAATGIIDTVMTISGVLDVASDAAGNIYALKNCSVKRLDYQGVESTISTSCQGQTNLNTDMQGNLYITHSGYKVTKNTFMVNTPATVIIDQPLNGSTWKKESGPLTLSATATDDEDGDITHQIVWVSSIDGVFTSADELKIGTHTITAKVTDSDGVVSEQSITLTVTSDANTLEPAGIANGVLTDNNNDGLFTGLTQTTALEVDYRSINYLNQHWRKRAIMEFDLTGLPSSKTVQSATLTINVSGKSNSPDVIISGYTGDGLVTLSDAQNPAEIIDQRIFSDMGNYSFDVTDLLISLQQAGENYLGISMKSAIEGQSNSDEGINFRGFNYSSAVFPGATLTVTYQ